MNAKFVLKFGKSLKKKNKIFPYYSLNCLYYYYYYFILRQTHLRQKTKWLRNCRIFLKVGSIFQSPQVNCRTSPRSLNTIDLIYYLCFCVKVTVVYFFITHIITMFWKWFNTFATMYFFKRYRQCVSNKSSNIFCGLSIMRTNNAVWFERNFSQNNF